MHKQQKKVAKIYQYIPYDDQSFDKVENSNSRPRTLPGSIHDIKQFSQSNQIQEMPNIRTYKQTEIEQNTRPLIPLQSPAIWSADCKRCEKKIKDLGQRMGLNINKNQIVKRIIPLFKINENSGMSYAVEYQSNRYQKFTSCALRKWYLQQMVTFLEQHVFEL